MGDAGAPKLEGRAARPSKAARQPSDSWALPFWVAGTPEASIHLPRFFKKSSNEILEFVGDTLHSWLLIGHLLRDPCHATLAEVSLSNVKSPISAVPHTGQQEPTMGLLRLVNLGVRGIQKVGAERPSD